MFNSFKVAVPFTLLSVYFSSATAYGIHNYEFKGKKAAWTFIMAVMMVPTQVFAIGFYQFMMKINLLDTYWPLIIPGITTPAVVFFMKQYMEGALSKELVEAARIDGAGPLTVLLKVYLPISLPALATVGLFAIVNHWNDYFSGLIYMSKASMYPLQTYIQQLTVDLTQITDADQLKQLSALNNRSFNAAKIVVSTIPLLIIYPFLQKYFVTGMVIGAVKE